MARNVVDIVLPLALDQPYSYRVPAEMELAPGDVVRVPLGASHYTAVVWGEGTARPGLDNRLKDVEDRLDIPPLKPELRRFVDWVAGYTLAPRGMVLRMCMRMGEHLGPERLRVGVRLAGPPPQRMTPARQRVLALLADGLVRSKGEVTEEAGVSPGVVDGLVDEGTLETLELMPAPVAHP
ncbi:MAG TPA: primosomal protein N', partial [Xanthobacteraceae bacterium]